MLTPELEVLKPIGPSISHADDYEIFALSNAQVVYQSNGKPASLLAAYADTPLRVEGRLESLDRGQLKYLVKKPFKPVDVVIRNVTRFSYGQMTDGELVIWALGEAGWFEIRPSRTYKAIYQDMVQAVELLYFITDIYSQPRKRGGGPNAQLVYLEYVEDERFPCSDPQVAAQIFEKHHEFLVMCFLSRAQGIGWSNTPIYQSFRRQYPQTFETAKARIEGRHVLAHKETRASKPSPTLAAAPTSTTQKPRAESNKSQLQKLSEHPKKDDNWWEAAAIYEFIRSAVNKRALKPGHSHITIDRVAKLMVRRYEIEEIETARNVLVVHAQNLCYKIDHPRSKSAAFLSDEPIYRELEAGHNLPAAEIRKAEAVQLRPRRDHALHRGQSDVSDSDSSSSSVIATPKRRSDGRKKKGRLSVLRPKSAKFSGKGKGVTRGKGKHPNREDTSVDEEEEEEADSSAEAGDESSTASDIDIDTPTQALSPSRAKRKLADATDDDESNGPRKRAASNSLTPSSPTSTSDSSSSTSSSSSSADAAAEADTEAPLPLRARTTNPQAHTTKTKSPASSKPALVLPIVRSPLPTYAPNGPRDSWICTFDGCSRRIYGASKELGRQIIAEHLEDHAKGRHGVVGILLREEERLRLPVNNLLKKIREMSEAQTPLFPAGPSSLQPRPQPQPIRRMV
ncbi:hypothetical protein K458DRAFT_444652 [Lentithecium fluviatile CBS 122367]|uniref:DNA (cytosine-5)-methyltransferase 1 replication foci domain-containing protein n=1 Tax=Lentithecium fluviatile CBS 122367 TaxID=1168545 RepID=A0A6G1IT26_9PLEO|nr:hypothetical protein K458DRAFT_444652 [Lentithecium fluviatile CBS 122367]